MVVCKNAWETKYTLPQLEKTITKDKLTIDTLWTLRASTWLHETLHHQIVAYQRGTYHRPLSAAQSKIDTV